MVIWFDNVCIFKGNLFGNLEIEVGKGFVGVMEIFDNIWLIVVVMVVGIGCVVLEEICSVFIGVGVEIFYDKFLYI